MVTKKRRSKRKPRARPHDTPAKVLGGAFLTTRRVTVGLLVLAVAVWSWAAYFHINTKTSYLDDAFIYFHIANNILEMGTARFYPIADSNALLASSPLRLLFLVPVTFIVRLLADPDRSIHAIRLTLLAYGLVVCGAFALFFRRRAHLWLAGTVVAGLIGLRTETGLQMEGLLIFWTVFALLLTIFDSEGEVRFGRAGLLIALMTLARPEYGLSAIVVVFAFIAYRRSRKALVEFCIPLGVCALLWILIASLLGVYPIPTTYVSKIRTAELGIFIGGRFTDTVFKYVRDYFWRMPDSLVLVSAAVVLGAIATMGAVYRWAVAFIVLVIMVVHKSAGNYLWYHENLFILTVTISLCAAITHWRHARRWWQAIALVVLVLSIVTFFRHAGRDHPLFWNFRAEHSRGQSYRAVGEAYAGEGRFQFDGLPPCYLVMNEVGITSYFAGAGAWIIDRAGLAQPGTLDGTLEHPLAVFFPRSLFRTPDDEFELIRRKFHLEGEPAPIYAVHGNPSAEHVSQLCDHYFRDTGVCLRAMR